jgi:DMSO/TMAO reductase YedYZ molybdopterin-dependent catalytic subunit
MSERRQFLRIILGLLASGGLILSPPFRLLASAYEKAKKIILPKGTGRETLIDKNPADLDTRYLETTSLERFGTMGLSDHEVKLETWRLEIDGHVASPLSLTYEELIALPSVEREVLLICPGFFANHGHWKGFSIGALLRKAGAKKDVTHLTLRGPRGKFESLQRYPIEDVRAEKVFLAYEVNGKTLPARHGFPLRAVAEGYYGYDWVKYVYRITAEKI